MSILCSYTYIREGFKSESNQMEEIGKRFLRNRCKRRDSTEENSNKDA
jgi:hypothetical protein